MDAAAAGGGSEGGRNVKRGGQGGAGFAKRLGARNEATASLRKQAVMSKRRCTDATGVLGADQLTREHVVACVEACKQSTAPGAAGPSADLASLRKALSTQDDAVIEYAVSAGAVDMLLGVLQGSCVENYLEAVWCVTNIASGSSEQTQLTLPLAPCIIQLLDTSDAALQEQCIWALGNMAGDNATFRDHVRANGATLPIVRKLQGGKTASVRRVAAWALSNFARGVEPKLQELFAAGAGEALVGALTEEGASEDLLVEVAWVLTFVTHGQEEFNAYLAASPALPLLLRLLQAQGGTMELLKALLNSDSKGLRKESAWTVSNIAAGSPAHREAVFASGIVADLCAVRGAEVGGAGRVLETLEGAQRLVEEADGIDALEQLVYSAAASPEMAARASFLVDKYYGEDAEPY